MTENDEIDRPDSQKGDQILKRMLKTPPKPHDSEKAGKLPKVERGKRDRRDKE